MRPLVLSVASMVLTAALGAADLPAPVLEPSQQSEVQGVISRYLEAVPRQKEAMLGAEMEVEIGGRFPKFEESGSLKVLRTISKVGQITFKAISDFSGADRVKKELITRYLSEEQEKQGYGALDILPIDYDFRIKAIVTRHANTPEAERTYVFDVVPRRNAEGLFKGELWLDGETGMPLRESGELVRNPHVVITRFAFVRDYELRDGVSVIKRMEGRVNVRFYGRAELDIDFGDVHWPDRPVEQALANSGE